jgi:hypothetical protein
MTTTIVKVVVVCALLVAVVGGYLYFENIDWYANDVLPNSLAVMCEQNGGLWVGNGECENLTENECSMFGGDYNGCASACRNNPDTDGGCIAVCVEVCSFNP